MEWTVRVEPHSRATVPWAQEHRGGTAADRRLDRIEVSLPPRIEDLDVAVPAGLVARMEGALRQIAQLDQTHGRHLAPLSTMLLRAESVASSKIERIEASLDDYARALHGSKANASATSMVASTRALADLIDTVTTGNPLTADAILAAHKVLMVDDEFERNYAGRWRDMQNWIGGSDYSPRGALFIPPPPDTVESSIGDLLAFANRNDVPTIVQAAVVHAQFESIHPFTDGNGRIGRALINAVLRRRGITTTTVVPLASALVARREDYFDALTAYRGGDVGPLVESFTSAATIAALEAHVTAQRLAELPRIWNEVAPARRGSASARIRDRLLDHPVFDVEGLEESTGASTSAIYVAIDALTAAGVIRPLTARRRNQVWVACDIADELDDLGVRIAARARTEAATP